MLARLAAQFGCEIGERIRIVARQLIDLARLCRRRQRNGGRFGVVGTRGGRNTPLAGAANEGAVLQRWLYARQVVLRVPTVAQQHEREAGLAQVGFGCRVFGGQTERRRIGMQDAGVGEQRDAGLLRRVDGVAMLRSALSDLARRDQQHFLSALERSYERSRVGVIGLADLNAQGGEIGSTRRIAHGGDDLAGRHFGQQ